MDAATENLHLRCSKVQNEFRSLKQIGKGSYGDVFRAERIEDGVQVCLKLVDLEFLSPHERLGCHSEVHLLQSLPRHPNVVSCYDAFWDDTSKSGGSRNSRLAIVLEYGDAGDLETLIQTERQQHALSADVALSMFAQIASGLLFLHQHHVLHRDIKSKNVFLFQSGRVVIGDFGTSKSLASTAALAATLVGSPLYMSPELLDDRPYSWPSDVWSLGCLLYELFAGQTPFTAASYPAVVFKITKGSYDPLPSSTPSEIQTLVESMLRLDPAKRPTVEEILRLDIIQRHLLDWSVSSSSGGSSNEGDVHKDGPLDCQQRDQIILDSAASDGQEAAKAVTADQGCILPPPPPTTVQLSALSIEEKILNALPPPPPIFKARPKPRRGSVAVFPTARASIANILSRERVGVHKERVAAAHHSKFLSCVPVMDLSSSMERRPGPTSKHFVKKTSVGKPLVPLPPDNMLIIGTKVSSVKQHNHPS